MWYWGDGMGWLMILNIIGMVVFWGGVIILVIWAVKKLSLRSGGGESRGALDILKERYARGEINKEQYEQMKKDLT
jgi:putative membrane protein